MGDVSSILTSGPFQASMVAGELAVRQDVPLQSAEFAWVARLMEQSFVRKYTRDRKGERVPHGLRLLRLIKVINCANWNEYATRRAQVVEQVGELEEGWNDTLKTDGDEHPEDEFGGMEGANE